MDEDIQRCRDRRILEVEAEIQRLGMNLRYKAQRDALLAAAKAVLLGWRCVGCADVTSYQALDKAVKEVEDGDEA
jgi:hypothetical protein